MSDIIPALTIIAAFSAYTAILVALGYLAGRLRAEYRVMRMLARRGLDVRLEHARQQEAQVLKLTETLKTVTADAKTAKAALERERAELAKAKGLVA